MVISFTVNELIDKDVWELVCKMKGINVWAVNEGLMKGSERIAFSEQEAKNLGLISSK